MKRHLTVTTANGKYFGIFEGEQRLGCISKCQGFTDPPAIWFEMNLINDSERRIFANLHQAMEYASTQYAPANGSQDRG